MESDLDWYEDELRGDAALCARILVTLPPVPDEPERVIRCSRENATQAVCRALALGAVYGALWRLEVWR
jgi:hypothetical protein